MSDTAIPETTVVVAGAFEGPAVERWGSLIFEALTLRPGRLTVDLRDCTLIDAAAIAVLLQAHRVMIHAGGRLTLRGPAARVRHILRLARVDHVFDTQAAEAATAMRS